MSLDEELEAKLMEDVKKDLSELLEEIEDMCPWQVIKELGEIIWGIGYNEGYFIGYHEGKTGRSFATQDEGS